MGYTTNFYGEFKLNTTLDKNTADLIKGIATTRRMKRSIPILAKKFSDTNIIFSVFCFHEDN